jgi:hypothetical protein
LRAFKDLLDEKPGVSIPLSEASALNPPARDLSEARADFYRFAARDFRFRAQAMADSCAGVQARQRAAPSAATSAL